MRTFASFQKHHRIPTKFDEWAEKFVGDLATDEIKEDLNEVHKRLRREYSLRRADMSVSHEDGRASIDTPYFQYSLLAIPNEEDLSEVIWIRQVSDIRERVQVLSDPFSRVFADVFDTVEYFPDSLIDVEGLIDRVEDLEDDRIRLDYDIDATSCQIEIEGVAGMVQIESQVVSMTNPASTNARDLLESFLEMQEMMGILRLD